MDENLSVEMGGNARASIVIAKETPAQVNKIQAESLTSVDFIIDSGANRDICRDKYLFQGNLVPKQTVIGEASAGHVFTAEAEGAISLKLKGRPLPLFERAIYSENVTENIMSIPEAVDAGFTVVFDKHGVKFYDSGGITQNKLPLIQGAQRREPPILCQISITCSKSTCASYNKVCPHRQPHGNEHRNSSRVYATARFDISKPSKYVS